GSLNRGKPPLLPIRQAHGSHAARPQSKISALVVGCAAESNHSERQLLHQLRFPYDSSLLIGIMPPNHSAFLSRNQDSFSAGQIPQDGRRAKIVVRTDIL